MTASAACEADVFNSEAASEARSVIKVPAQRPFLPSGSPMLSVSSPGKGLFINYVTTLALPLLSNRRLSDRPFSELMFPNLHRDIGFPYQFIEI